MQSKHIWIIAVYILLCMMLFCNRKVRLWSLLTEQIRVFRNDKEKRISLWDCICFLILPVAISVIIVYKLGFIINNNLAELLTTVFSFVFTVLFGFATIMISKIDSQNKIEKQVAKETFVSIVSSTILSLIAAVLSIVLTQAKSAICLQIISSSVVTISLIIIMLLLLITKRVFLLYVDRKD